jgi:hypothetical protein
MFGDWMTTSIDEWIEQKWRTRTRSYPVVVLFALQSLMTNTLISGMGGLSSLVVHVVNAMEFFHIQAFLDDMDMPDLYLALDQDPLTEPW